MHAPAQTPPTPTGPDPAAPPITVLEGADATTFYISVLQVMLEVGKDVARALQRQIAAEAATPRPAGEPAPPPNQDLNKAYDRLTRSVRRTILLAEQLLAAPTPHPIATRPSPPLTVDTAGRAARPPAPHQPAPREPASREINRRDHPERLDRLDRLDRQEPSSPSDPAKIVTAVCRDIGLAQQAAATPLAPHSIITTAAPTGQRFDPSSPRWRPGQPLPPRHRGGTGPP